mgnify:CR=1 FL=1
MIIAMTLVTTIVMMWEVQIEIAGLKLCFVSSNRNIMTSMERKTTASVGDNALSSFVRDMGGYGYIAGFFRLRLLVASWSGGVAVPGGPQSIRYPPTVLLTGVQSETWR